MKVRHLVAAAATALLLSPAVFAASTPPATCSTLQAQFDKQALKTASANANKARDLRAAGARLCSEGKSTEGVRKLNEAIKMLGASPRS
ncbi:MAG: hypothetical protein WBO00_11980 [Steroidobacteraceae bacterium]